MNVGLADGTKYKNPLEQFMREVLHFKNDDLVEQLLSFTTKKEYSCNEIIAGANTLQYGLQFLIKGVARGFYCDENGKEITNCFMTRAGQCVSGPHIAPEQVVNSFLMDCTVIACADCETVVLPYILVNELFAQYPETIMFYLNILSENVSVLIEREQMLYQKKPEKRFAWLVTHRPEWASLFMEDGVIRQMDIASFLNMTPQTLSKVMKVYKTDGML